jgi:hypothetical protein
MIQDIKTSEIPGKIFSDFSIIRGEGRQQRKSFSLLVVGNTAFLLTVRRCLDYGKEAGA